MASNTKCDQDWQLTKKTVLERNSHMFNNPLMSDIKLNSFYAHKYVLASSSPVFYAMFYGDLAEKNSVIHLPADEGGRGLRGAPPPPPKPNGCHAS